MIVPPRRSKEISLRRYEGSQGDISEEVKFISEEMKFISEEDLRGDKFHLRGEKTAFQGAPQLTEAVSYTNKCVTKLSRVH